MGRAAADRAERRRDAVGARDRLRRTSGVRVKLLLIAFAGINALTFHNGVYRSASTWDQHQPTPLAAKASALLSLAIWLGVITCGRLIAYL
jgi:hypothetical protein